MLSERYFIPGENQLIYHYCSAESFHAICSNKTIRLSDILSMNDSMEMQWGHDVFKEVTKELSAELENDFIKHNSNTV